MRRNTIIKQCKGKGIRFIVLYPPKCSHDLPPLAGTVHTETISIPPRDIPEQLAAYSAQALSTALLMLDANVHAARSAPKSETAADVTN